MGLPYKWPGLAALSAACILTLGCKQSTEKIKPGTETYSLKGTVVAVDAEQGEVTLQHDAIPGFMGAMTMPYKLLYGNSVSELHKGDVIRARLTVEKTPDGDYRNAKLDELAVLGQARPDFKPQSNYHVPTVGDSVPNFHFINQDGKAVQMSGFHGKTLLVTFIYTRCPLGDFCPKMSRNFAAIETALRKEPSVFERTQLLSLSFDPAFDTPAVLRSYGSNYTGTSGFAHWQFAAPSASTLASVEQFFNLGATGSGASLTHSLSTVLIGPDGRVAAWYPGSEWAPEEVVSKMKELTNAAPHQQQKVELQRGPLQASATPHSST
ncbi:MAG: SCO family protein [Janthinobacterium lividum]